MPARQDNDSAPRPLLVNGEALSLDVRTPPSGGGEKFNPRTVQEAQELLTPQVTAVSQAVEGMPQYLRAKDHVYVEARLLANYLAASYFPAELFNRIGAVPVGSRADMGSYVTKAKGPEAKQTRRLIVAVSDDGVSELRGLIVEGGRYGVNDKALAQIQRLDEIALPRRRDVLQAPTLDQEVPASGQRVWEAVLHPVTFRLGEPVLLDDDTLERWFALIAEEGGEVHRNYIRRVGGLTFTPVSLDSGSLESVARFNPLRVLRPMPAIRPRPRFGTRSVQRLAAPTTNQPVLSTVSVAVFDGGVDTARTTEESLFAIPTHDLTPEPPDHDNLNHGTGVTGAAAQNAVGKPGRGSAACFPPASGCHTGSGVDLQPGLTARV